MAGQTGRSSMSLVAQADDMIRQTHSLLTSVGLEDQLTELLHSQQTLIQKLMSENKKLEISHKEVMDKYQDLCQSSRRMECQLNSVRTALVNEKASKKGMRQELDYYHNMISQLRSMVHVETGLPAESPVRQIISRQMSRVAVQQANEMRNGLDTTDDSLSDLEYDKSEEELNTTFCLTAETPPAMTPSSSPIHPHDSSSFMSVSYANMTVVEAAVEAKEVFSSNMEEAQGQVKQGPALIQQSANPSTSTLASVTSQKSKCSVPSDMLMKSIESRAHDFRTKKVVGFSTCAGCKRTLFYSTSSVKCCSCSAVAHSMCQNRVPVPCLPAAPAPTSKSRQSCSVSSIADYCPVERPCVPPILVLCLSEIEKRGSAIDRPYVREDDLSLGAKVKSLILSSKCAPDLTSYSVLVLCAAVKSFLRSLDEPLITRLLWHDFATAAALAVKHDRENAFYTPIAQLPDCNRHSLAYLCKHIHTIRSQPQCRMTYETLATVFASLIVGQSGSKTMPHEMRGEKAVQKSIMLCLLQDIPSTYWNHVLALPRPGCQTRLSRHSSSASTRSHRRVSLIRGGAAVSNARLGPLEEVSPLMN